MAENMQDDPIAIKQPRSLKWMLRQLDELVVRMERTDHTLRQTVERALGPSDIPGIQLGELTEVHGFAQNFTQRLKRALTCIDNIEQSAVVLDEFI